MNPDRKIDVGDVVQRKDGGPWMTVDRLDGQSAVCLWEDAAGLHWQIYLLDDLVFPDFGADEDLI